MQRTARPGRKAGAVEEDTCAIDDPRLAAGQLAFCDMIRTLLLGPTADSSVLLVLPLTRLQLLDCLADPLLVLRVGEVGTQGAAAVVRPVGVDALAAVAVNAGPSRSEPGEIAAKDLAGCRLDREIPRKRGESRSALLARAPVYAWQPLLAPV